MLMLIHIRGIAHRKSQSCDFKHMVYARSTLPNTTTDNGEDHEVPPLAVNYWQLRAAVREECFLRDVA